MKKYNKMQIFAWVLAIIPMIAVAIVYHSLPNQIPSNWNLDGTVEYSEKQMILWMAVMPIVMELMFWGLAKIDPKRKNYAKFMSSYEIFQVIMMLFMIIFVGIILVECFYPGSLNVEKLVFILIGLLFVLLGNMMPKFKQNFFCGFKTPWTIQNENVWIKTNRLAGKMMFCFGIAIAFGAFLPEKIAFILLMAGAIIFVAVPTVYSYFAFQKEDNS